jgi:hypothetical protein
LALLNIRIAYQAALQKAPTALTAIVLLFWRASILVCFCCGNQFDRCALAIVGWRLSAHIEVRISSHGFGIRHGGP